MGTCHSFVKNKKQTQVSPTGSVELLKPNTIENINRSEDLKYSHRKKIKQTSEFKNDY